MAKQSQSRTRDDSDDEEGQRGGSMAGTDTRSAAAQLVRMALFHEYKRAPLQRKVAAAAIIPNNTRSFPSVLLHAQTILKNTFGMELYELRTKQKVNEDAETQKKQSNEATQQPTQGEKATDLAARGAKGSGAYMLRSILPADVIEGMVNPVSLPLAEDMTPAEMEIREADSGALIQWEKGDGTASGNVALLGIRTVILCLVLCGGRAMSDNTLHAHLRSLNLSRDTVLPFKSKDTAGDFLSLDKYLDLLAKQNYLEKAKVDNPTGEGTVIEWRWGSREAEFSEEAAAKFIEKMFLGEEGEESEGEPEPSVLASQSGQPATSEERREKKRRRLRADLERVVGGPLLGKV